jgi:hypothetical protein
MVCNAIRKAEHETNVLGRQLKDEEVLAIGVKAQADYHKTELMRFINSHSHVLAGNTAPAAGGTTLPPDDLEQAARDSLGGLFNEFISIYGADFTPLQLAQFCDGSREDGRL